jgi:hypothetical protein
VWLPAGTQRNAAANLAEYNQFRHPVQRNAATEYNVMPPLDWWPDECSKSHARRRRAREIRTWSKPHFSLIRLNRLRYQRGLMFSDPALLAQYDVYAGAANYGLALRKNSPYRPQIEQQMQVYWNAVYPGYRIGDYHVRSANWSGKRSR